MRTRTLLATLLAAALAGCGACDTPPPDALEDCAMSAVFPGRVKTDLLFVIDDSGSMSEEQTLLRDGLASFIGALAATPVANQFQIGVTTTSVADFDGTTVAPDGDLVGPILVSSSVSLVSDFESQVAVGTAGSGREQPFEAAKRALLKSAVATSPNYGLLRPGARLAVIFLSDEDDCSGPQDPDVLNNTGCRVQKAASPSALTSVASFDAFLSSSIAGETRDVIVAAIVGVAPGTLELSCSGAWCTNQACSTALDKGDRFAQLLGMRDPARTRLASICDSSFEQALRDFAAAIMSQTLPLDGAVADYRLLVPTVTKASGATATCTVASESDPANVRNSADALYKAPHSGQPASLTFQNACTLEPGDGVSIDVVCIR